MDDRTHMQYSLAILGLIHVKQWHQRERDEAAQRSPVLRDAQFVEGVLMIFITLSGSRCVLLDA